MRIVAKRGGAAMRLALLPIVRLFVRVESCRVGDDVRSFVAIIVGA